MNTSDVRIIILDDDENVRLNLVAFFEDEGFTVISAATAEEALDIIRNQPIQLGIIDIRLPGMDGNFFILEAHQQQPGMKFVIHTGSMEYVLPDSLSAIGIRPQHIFLKPLSNMEILAEALKKLIHPDNMPP
jgi:DNA-binding NtrC family response regulator